MILLTGCSWSIIPFVRNFEVFPITMTVTTKTYTPIDVDFLTAYTKKGILEMNPKSKYEFKDTLIYQIVDSISFKIIIPPKSTNLVQLPYGWNYRDYIITFGYPNNQIDTLGKSLNYKILKKNGDEIKNTRPHRKQILYIDLKQNEN